MKTTIFKTAIVALVIFTVISGKLLSQMISPVISLTGSVYDAITKEPVTVMLVVSDETGKRLNAARSNATENGTYFLTSMKAGHKYSISISTPNYLKEKYSLFIQDATNYTELSKDFLVKPVVVGAMIPLRVPPFELNKSKLRVGAEDVLEDIKSTLENNPNVKFQIVCYPDNAADKAENKTLTEERAKSLMTFFTANGIDAGRITTTGSATTDPKNPPPTKKAAKGKRYIGPTYIKITEF